MFAIAILIGKMARTCVKRGVRPMLLFWILGVMVISLSVAPVVEVNCRVKLCAEHGKK